MNISPTAIVIGLIVIALVIAGAVNLGRGRLEEPRAASNSKAGKPGDRPPPTNSLPEIQDEVGRLSGTWNGVSFHVDGFQDRVAEVYRYTFSGDQMTTETNLAGPAAVKYYLDPGAHPKRLDTSITVNGEEQISKGIYSLKDDVLQLSWTVGGDRPVDFQSRDGDEKIVLVLRRAEE